MIQEVFLDNITVYKDDAGNVILAFQDIPIRHRDEYQYGEADDENPDEIISYSTVAVDLNSLSL